MPLRDRIVERGRGTSLSYRVGVDVGGTFTDLVALEERTGELVNVKVLSTPKNPILGIERALELFLKETGAKRVSVVVHATTIASNMLLGQVGLELPKTAFVTTKGFRDVVEIGRQRRPELYNVFVTKPKPLVPRRYRFEVEERIDARGEVIKPLNLEQLSEVADILAEERFESVAVGFLNSYANPKHELEAKEFLQRKLPDAYVTASYEVCPQQREYERFSTAIVNAVLQPVVSKYLEQLGAALEKLDVKAPVYVMQSSGGVASFEEASKKPFLLVESGPVAGVVAASFYAKLLGLENAISFDMGGTTAKAGVVVGGEPEYVDEYEVREIARFLASFDRDIPYSLLAFHPDYLLTDLPPTSTRHAKAALKAAKEEGLRRVNVGNVWLLGDYY